MGMGKIYYLGPYVETPQWDDKKHNRMMFCCDVLKERMYSPVKNIFLPNVRGSNKKPFNLISGIEDESGDKVIDLDIKSNNSVSGSYIRDMRLSLMCDFKEELKTISGLTLVVDIKYGFISWWG